MSDKLRRITAWAALVFMAVFTVSFVIYLVDNMLLEGRFVMLPIFFGSFGVLLFFIIKLDDKRKSLEKRAIDGDSMDDTHVDNNKADTTASDTHAIDKADSVICDTTVRDVVAVDIGTNDKADTTASDTH